MKMFLTLLWLALIFSSICLLFYRMQWVYGMPTPVPKNYHNVALGTSVNLEKQGLSVSQKPLFIHFFNPSCPCSKFNIPHFRMLVQKYKGQVDFVIALLNEESENNKTEIQEKFGFEIPVLRDSSIAIACGVYSTPQAVIISPDGRLYYRGNYNKSRYCSEKKTEFARLALEGLLQSDTTVIFDELALKAYGCKVPLCKSK